MNDPASQTPATPPVTPPIPPITPPPTDPAVLAKIASLEKQLADEQAHTHPFSRAASRVKSDVSGVIDDVRHAKAPGITLWGVAKATWHVWVTFMLLPAIGAFSLMALPGCPAREPAGPKPLSEHGNRLVVVYDAGSRMDPDLQSALWSEAVWQYAGANLATGPEGTAEARIFDQDADVSGEHPVWQEAMARAKGKNLPYVLLSGVKQTYEGDIPKTTAGMIDLIKKCFGTAKLPPPARGPPMMVTDNLTPELNDPAGGRKKGLLERNFKTHPVGYATKGNVFDLPLMSDAEIEAAIKRKDADKSWIDNVRDRGNKGGRIPSRDQDGKGYCWAHSSTSATLCVRALNNQPYSDLSAYAVACIIKGYRDEGGWGAESLAFIAERGVPSSKFWPQQSMSQGNDNANTWDDAKKHRITEWMEIDPTSKDAPRMLATCLCNNIPVVSDFNWWGHSVCTVRLKAWGGGGPNLKTTIWNSWGDGWSSYGMGDLQGAKALPDAMIAPRVTVAAFAQAKRPTAIYATNPAEAMFRLAP